MNESACTESAEAWSFGIDPPPKRWFSLWIHCGSVVICAFCISAQDHPNSLFRPGVSFGQQGPNLGPTWIQLAPCCVWEQVRPKLSSTWAQTWRTWPTQYEVVKKRVFTGIIRVCLASTKLRVAKRSGSAKQPWRSQICPATPRRNWRSHSLACTPLVGWQGRVLRICFFGGATINSFIKIPWPIQWGMFVLSTGGTTKGWVSILPPKSLQPTAVQQTRHRCVEAFTSQ